MVTVIVVGFNSKRYLKDCFAGLFQSRYLYLRVIYVDNCSDDGSVDYVVQNFPQVIILQQATNQGYAEANNTGIKQAISLGTDYIYLLNPDTFIDRDCIDYLVASANQDTILQPLILLYDQKKTQRINTRGNYLNFLGVSYCDGYNLPAHEVTEASIPSASGAAMFFHKNIVTTVGLLDSDFFMYHEDLDFCWRARSLGYDIKIVPQALVWHKYSFSRNKTKIYYVERNRLLFLYKNFDNRTLWLIAPMFIVNELLACGFSLKEGYLKNKLRSYVGFWRLLPRYRQLRESLRSQKTKHDHQLKQYIGASVNYGPARVPFLPVYNRVLSAYWFVVYPLI